jgi:hypothetical protein
MSWMRRRCWRSRTASSSSRVRVPGRDGGRSRWICGRNGHSRCDGRVLIRLGLRAWLAEGLLPFLPNAAKQRLLSAVDELAVAGSSIELEYIDDLARLRRDPEFQERWTRMAERMGLDITQLWPDEEDFPVDTWLSEHGWTVTVERVGDVAQRYGAQFAEQAMLPTHAVRFITARQSDKA